MLNNKRAYFLLGFLLISVVYALYNIYLVEVNNYADIPKKIRGVYRLLSIVTVYVIGFYFLKKYNSSWIRVFWNALYITIVSLLILIGIYDWSSGHTLSPAKDISSTFYTLLISPLLYTTLLIVNRTLMKIAEK